MPKMYLRQPGCTYSACGQFTKNKAKIKKFKETWDSRHNYLNKLEKVCFEHEMASECSKNVPRKIASDKLLQEKAFNFAKNSEYVKYRKGFALLFYEFVNKKSADYTGTGINS